MTKRKNNRIKRDNNEGSIFQRKSGQWVGAVTTGYNKDGVQQKKLYMEVQDEKLNRNWVFTQTE